MRQISISGITLSGYRGNVSVGLTRCQSETPNTVQYGRYWCMDLVLPSSAPSLSCRRPRWLVALGRWRQRLANGLRFDLGPNGFQDLDARRQEIAVTINEAV